MSEQLLWTAALGLVASIVLHSFQKWRDRRELVRSRHFDVYVEMIEAVCGMGISHMRGSGGEDALDRYFSAKAKFAVVASDEVMRHFVKFDRLISSGEPVANEAFDQAFGAFMLAARAENLGSTGLTPDEMVIVTPYGKSVRRGKS